MRFFVGLLLGSLLVGCGGGGGEGGAGETSPSPITFSVSTTTTGTGTGTFSPGSATVAQGRTTSFTISASSDSVIAGVSGCGGSLSGNTYTTGPISGNCTISATFDQASYEIITTAGAGGSISPNSITVSHGETTTFALSPDSGQEIEAATGCDGTLNGHTYTTGPITEVCTVSATFRPTTVTPPTFSVTTSTTGDGSGTISPNSAAVEQGRTASFTISPTDDSELDSVSGCSGSLSGDIYTTGAISENCLVTAVFRTTPPPPPVTYLVSTVITGNGNGSISPGSTNVEVGESAVFELNPASDSTVSSVTGCGGSLSDNTYTTVAISEDCLITATFVLNTYTITASAGEGGSISPGSVEADHFSTLSFEVTPEVGYGIASVTGCGGSLEGTSYTTGEITGACVVSATFSLNSYTVTASAGEGGEIAPSSVIADHGTAVTFSITVSEGYDVDTVEGCDGTLENGSYTTSPIIESCAVTASFVAQAPAQPDTTAPALIDFEITIDSLIVDQGNAAPEYQLVVEDEGSGVEQLQVHLISPSGNQRNAAVRSFTDSPRYFSGTIVGPNLPGNAEAGVWTIDFVYLADSAGNDVFIRGDALRERGFETEILVDSSSPDTTPPTLEFFDILTSVVDVSAATGSARYSIEVLDDISGLASLQIQLVSPIAGQRNALVLNVPGEQQFFAEVTGPVFSEYAETGVWEIDFVYLQDVAGNTDFVQATELTQLGFPSELTITGSTPDIAPPELIFFSIITEQVSISGGDAEPVYSLELRDDLSGLRSLQIHVVSPSGQRNTVVRNFAADTMEFVGEVGGSQFSSTAELGTWNIDFIFIEDQAGNRIFIGQSDLDLNGFNSTIQVIE